MYNKVTKYEICIRPAINVFSFVRFCPWSTLNVTCNKWHKFGNAKHARLEVATFGWMQQAQQNNNLKFMATNRMFVINEVETSQSKSLVRSILSITKAQS